MITDNNNVIYSDDMKILTNGSQCNALIYKVPEGVEFIDDSAFDGNTDTQMLVLPHSCRALGDGAFAGMKNVEFISMENTQIIEIHDSCFKGDENLRCIFFPPGLESVQNWVFTGAGLYKLDFTTDFPNVEYFASYAFEASNVKHLTINAIYRIGFRDCKQLEKLTVSEGVKEIYCLSFKGCTSLKEINLPESLEVIGEDTFFDSPIEELTLPKNLRRLGNNCIKWGALTQLSSLSPYFIVEDNTLYNADKSQVIGFWGDSVESLKVNQPLINPYAFRGNQKITELDLPNIVEADSPLCFEGMTSLKRVNIASSYGGLAQHAFSGCVNLTEVVLNKFHYLDAYAFHGCKELTTFKGDDIHSIGAHCFEGCTKLSSVSMQEIVIIEEYAFLGCDSIANLKLTADQCIYGRYALKRHCFAGMGGLKEIEIPDGVKTLNHNFNDCISLEKVKLPPSIQKISFGSLGSNCPALKEILVPKSELSRFQTMLNKKFHSLLKTF